jgi:deazaflavin-dependent oxidoreductase (nitroreductase family)
MAEDNRPQTSSEKAKFSAGGRTQFLILRGKWGLAIDTAVLWLTGYSLMTKQYSLAQRTPYVRTLLLTTTGARTGQKRTCGLPYWRVGNDYIVRGSNGGGPTDPHWCHNIRKNPDVRLRVKRRTKHVKAHVSTGEERERLFKIMAEKSSSTEMYQNMCTPRELPLVVLRDAAL